MEGWLASQDIVGQMVLPCRLGKLLPRKAEAYDHDVILELRACVRLVLLRAVLSEEGADLLGERRRCGDERRRKHHGKDADGQEHLMGLRTHEPSADAGGCQHKGKFAGLGKAQGGANGCSQGVALNQDGRHAEQGLADDVDAHAEQDGDKMGSHKAQIEHHAHGDEEEAQEDVPVGQNVGHGAHGIARAGQHEACQEGAQGEGHAKGARYGGKAQAQAERGQQEQLAGTGLHHGCHEPVQDKAGKGVHGRGKGRHLDNGQGHGQEGDLHGAGQKGHKEHHGCHEHVLEDQDGQGETTHRCGRDAFLLEDVQHDGRRGQGNEAAPEDAGLQVVQEEADAGRGGNDEPYLQAAAQEDRALEPVQDLAGKFHADGEHEHGHAKVGCRGDDLHVAHNAQHGGAAQDAREQKAHRDRQLEA